MFWIEVLLVAKLFAESSDFCTRNFMAYSEGSDSLPSWIKSSYLYTFCSKSLLIQFPQLLMGPETGLLTVYNQVVTTYTDHCYTNWLRIMPQISFMFYIVNFPWNYIIYIIRTGYCVYVCFKCLSQEKSDSFLI